MRSRLPAIFQPGSTRPPPKGARYAAIRIGHVAACAVALLALSGCDGGSDGAAPPANDDEGPTGTSASLFPLAVGDRRVFRVIETQPADSSSELIEVETVVDPLTLAHGTVQVLETRNATTGFVQYVRYNTADAQGFTDHYADNYRYLGQALSSVLLVRTPVREGDRVQALDWKDIDSGEDYDGDGTDDKTDLSLSTVVRGIEEINVPAGTFQARRITTERRQSIVHSSSGARKEYLWTTDEWRAPGVGLVQERVIRYFPDSTEQSWRQLVAYAVGGQRSDALAPRLATTAPAAASSAWPELKATLDEIIPREYRDTVQVRVADSHGDVIPGETFADARDVRFEPMRPLQPGTYTATVTGLQDLIGNADPAPSWEFTVSAPPPGDPLSYFPLQAGNRWIYEMSLQENGGAITYSKVMDTLAASEIIAGLPTLRLERRDANSLELLGWSNLRKTDAALEQVFETPVPGPGGSWNAITFARLPLENNRQAATLLQRGMDLGRDIDGDGIAESYDRRVETRVDAGDPVSIPGGYFLSSQVLQIRDSVTITSSAGQGELNGMTITTETLVPSVGPVLIEQTEYWPGSTVKTRQVLTGWEIDGRRSERFAPSLDWRSPAYSGSRTIVDDIVLVFSEMIDGTRLQANEFELVDGALAGIRGALSRDGASLRFTPEAPLADGTYTFRIGAVSDLVGNVRPAEEWTFTVDTIAPTLVDSSIADGDTGVHVIGQLLLEFSEAMIPDYWSNPVEFTRVGGSAFQPPVQFDGNKFTYSLNLEHGATYQVTLTDRLKDIAGNPLPAWRRFRFTTLPSLFRPLVDIPHFGDGGGIAIGDVNGDGRADLVNHTGTSSNLTGVDGHTLFIRLQNDAGQLEPPVRLPLQCEYSSVDTGDVGGDGRADILVVGAGRNCGIRLFEYSPGTGWANTMTITPASYHQHGRLADVNADGLLDVLATSSEGLSVWYRQTAGGFAARTVVPFADAVPCATGDINGDSLQDVVGRIADRLVILKQRAAGGFTSPRTISIGDTMTQVAGCTIGDMNQDGRLDIVATHWATQTNAGSLAVLLQQADGSLAAPDYYPQALPLHGVAMGDIDGDRRPDLVSTSSRLGVNLQDANGALAPADQYTYYGATTDGLAIGDLDGDGRLDVATSANRHLNLLYALPP